MMMVCDHNVENIDVDNRFIIHAFFLLRSRKQKSSDSSLVKPSRSKVSAASKSCKDVIIQIQICHKALRSIVLNFQAKVF